MKIRGLDGCAGARLSGILTAMGQMHWHWFIGPVVAVMWAAVFGMAVYLAVHFSRHHHN